MEPATKQTNDAPSNDRLCGVPGCDRPKFVRGICHRHYFLHYKGREDYSAYITSGLAGGAIDRRKPDNPAELPHWVAAQVARVLGLKVRPEPPPSGVTLITGPDGRTVLVTPECDVILLPDE